jgi:hypothetical protein
VQDLRVERGRALDDVAAPVAVAGQQERLELRAQLVLARLARHHD